MNDTKTQRYSFILTIIGWGAIWGILESTVGYLLHVVSFGYGWLVWVPVACFFMANVYRKTRRVSSVFLAGLLCASVKMVNLLLPGRIDKVINPAVSIVFEALAMGAVILGVRAVLGAKNRNPLVKAVAALCMNTGWRLLYIAYLAFLVPAWIRDVSVISNRDAFVLFFITQNLLSTAVIFIGYLMKDQILKPVAALEEKAASLRKMPMRVPLQFAGVALMLCISITLEYFL